MNMPFQGAKLALLTGRHVLTLLRDDRPGLAHAGFWDLPGGGREGGEDPLDCALRETREELGLELPRTAVSWGRRFESEGLGSWFFGAVIQEDLLRHIRFGDEGQGWAVMTHALFLSHPKVIAHYQLRLRLCLEEIPLT